MGSLSLLQGIFPTQIFEPRSPTLQVDSLPAEPRGKPKNIGVGSQSLLQRIFPTQESNQGLLHCRQILYQLSYERRHKGRTINEKEKFVSLNQNHKLLFNKRHAKTVERKINQEKILSEYIIDKELISKNINNFHKYIRKRQHDKRKWLKN